MDNHSFRQTPEKNSSQLEQQKERQAAQAENIENEQLSSEVSEMMEGVESAVEMGEVNENVKEGKKKTGSGTTSTSGQTTASQVAKKITPPSVEVMRTQISVKVKKEIIVLEKEAKRLSQNSQFNPFQLNAVVAKIRDLKEILASLSYATLETLKTWWFKYVKGITS